MPLLLLTFGGMWRWRRVAVARVFALVVRSRVIMLFVYSRVGKNRDTRRECPAGAGAGRTADYLTILFSQKVLAVRSANAIYRPVIASAFFLTQVFSIIGLANGTFLDRHQGFLDSPLAVQKNTVTDQLV